MHNLKIGFCPLIIFDSRIKCNYSFDVCHSLGAWKEETLIVLAHKKIINSRKRV